MFSILIKLLARDSIYAIARYMLWPIHNMSVRPCHTGGSVKKRLKLGWLTSPQNFKGNLGSGGAE